MDQHERSSKRLCVRDCEATPALLAMEDSIEAIKCFPEELLVEIFAFADVSTRLTLRKVRRHWQHVIQLAEVNRIVLIDRTLFDNMKSMYGPDGRPYYRSWWGTSTRQGTIPALTALLGDHVRHVVYDGAGFEASCITTGTLGQDIGWLCSQIPRLVDIHLRRINFQSYSVANDFNTFPRLLQILVGHLGHEVAAKSLTLHLCEFRMKMSHPVPRKTARAFRWTFPTDKVHVGLGREKCEELRRRTPTDGEMRMVTDSIIWPYANDQTDWVAQWASQLPVKKYWNISLQPLEPSLRVHGTLPANDPLYYHCLDKEVLLLLARCILDHKNTKNMPMFPAPPTPFPDDFMQDAVDDHTANRDEYQYRRKPTKVERRRAWFARFYHQC